MHGLRMLLAVGFCAGCWASHPLLTDAGAESSAPRDGDATTDAGPPDGSGEGDGARPDARDAGDGEGDGAEAEAVCPDDDGDGHAALACGGDDCDDGDPTVFPGAAEVCGDGRDGDCDGRDPVEGLLEPPRTLLEFDVHEGGSHPIFLSLLWTGREYALVWSMATLRTAYLARLDAAGNRLTDDVVLLDDVDGGALQAVWMGTRLGAVWAGPGDTEDERFLWRQAFDAAGTPLTDQVRISELGRATGSLRVAPIDEDLLIAWIERRAERLDNHGLWAVRVDADGRHRFPPVQVASFWWPSSAPLDLAWNGTEALVLWWPLAVDLSGSRAELHLRRLGLLGELLGDEQLLTEQGNFLGPPVLLWTGTEYAVFWVELEPHRPMLARCDESALEISHASLDPPLTGAAGGHALRAAWDGHRLGVLWMMQADGPRRELTLRRFTTTGEARGTTITIPAGFSATQYPMAIVWTGGEYAFVWSETEIEPDGGSRQLVRFARATFCDE